MGLFDQKKPKKGDFFDSLFNGIDAINKFIDGVSYKLEERNRRAESIQIQRKESIVDISYLKYNELKALNRNKKPIVSHVIDYDEPYLIYICGERGSGKTALGMKILENTLKNTKINVVYAIGFKDEDLPEFISPLDIENIEDIENDSLIIIDEGGLNISARESMSRSNINLSKILFITRHLNTKIVFCSQQSSSIDVNVIRNVTHIFFKPFSLLQKEFERREIRDLYEKIEPEFNKKLEKYGKELSYLYSKKYKGFVFNSLPSFWSNELSRGYRKEN